MDSKKTGALLGRLRRERGFTQRELAQRLHITDKTISKWERGAGLPDIAMLTALAEVFQVEVKTILEGDLTENKPDGGNMKRVKFYVCPQCGNTLTATGGDEISCCGRTLTPLTVQKEQGEHPAKAERVEDDYYVTIDHEMRKNHHLSFAAYVDMDRLLLMKLYPEQVPEVRFPRMSGGKFYYHCNCCGLFEAKLP